jgi:hypothetical protein
MMQTLLIYTAFRYGNIGTKVITEQFVEEFPYMDGCNMALLVPDKHINRASITLGLLSPFINEGAVVK